MSTTDAHAHTPSKSLQFWSLALPVLKCAICPACLSIFGGLFAGARLGFLGDERIHSSVVAVAIVADLFILRAALQHHRSLWPLALCLAGAALALAGHFVIEAMEYVGFALLMAAAIQNLVLIRRHRLEGGTCCPHEGVARRPIRCTGIDET